MVSADANSSTEGMVVKLIIYTHAHAILTVQSYTCAHFSVPSFLSGITGQSLKVSRSHTEMETNWGAEWGSGRRRCSYDAAATTRARLRSVKSSDRGNCGKISPSDKNPTFSLAGCGSRNWEVLAFII